MSESIHPIQVASPEAITRFFAHIMSAPTYDETTKELGDQADAAWSIHPELSVNQDGIIGNFTRESTTYFAGSLIGYAVQLTIATPTGQKNLELRLGNNDTPAFTITET